MRNITYVGVHGKDPYIFALIVACGKNEFACHAFKSKSVKACDAASNSSSISPHCVRDRT